jgi:hypothetical protein
MITLSVNIRHSDSCISYQKYSGVDVSLWVMNKTSDWSLNLEELAGMIKPNTKVIVIK